MFVMFRNVVLADGDGDGEEDAIFLAVLAGRKEWEAAKPASD